MTTFIALLRGINVGGRNKLPMAELRSQLEELGVSDVKTYIQSGNVVFRGDFTDRTHFAADLSTAIEARHGFAPQVMIIDRDEWQQAMARNPFPDGVTEPKTLHLYFLATIPAKPNLEKLTTLQSGRERFRLDDRVFYLHTPDGFGRSKLAASVERALGVAATARNWRSIEKIMALIEQVDDADRF